MDHLSIWRTFGVNALALAVAAWLCVMLNAPPASAQVIYMGNCANDETIAPEKIVVACTSFIQKSLIENWGTQYIYDAIYFRALANERRGRDADAERDLHELMVKAPEIADAWIRFGEIYGKQNGGGGPMQMLDLMVKTNPGNAQVLNAACWARATRNENLDTALAECGEAVLLAPHDENMLDSRGFVHFRMADYADAIADTTAALAINPKLSASLYVRGLAKLKTGDAAGGNADIAAAKAVDPGVADSYASFGVKP